jgi:hypothetical protein
MTLKCKTCGGENPDANCFCGHCGKVLERRLPGLPPASRAGVTALAPAPPVKIGVSANRPLPSPTQDQEKPRFEPLSKERAELEKRAAIVRWKEADLESLGEFLPWNSADAPQPTPLEIPNPVGTRAAKLLEVQEPDEVADPQPADPQPMLSRSYDPEPNNFLRNLALAVLAIGAILGSQWSFIRDHAFQKKNLITTQSSFPAIAANTPGRVPSLSEATPTVAALNNAAPDTPTQRVEVPIHSAPSAGRLFPPAANSPEPRPAPPSASPAAGAASVAADPTPPTHARAPLARPRPSAMSAPAAEAPAKTQLSQRPLANIRTVASFSSAPPAHGSAVPGADSLDHAYRAGDPAARAAWLWIAVGEGNPQASVELARMYRQGSGVVRSCEQARLLLRAAAANGNEQAKLNLVQMLREGCSER